jgi:WD40 repeat protein
MERERDQNLITAGSQAVCSHQLYLSPKIIKPHVPFQATFSPNGTVLASNAGAHYEMLPVKLRTHAGRVENVQVDVSKEAIQLYTVRTGKKSHLLIGHNGWIKSVAFNPSSTMLASVADSNSICLWDVTSGTEIQTLTTPYTGAACSIAFSPDGNTLAAAFSNNFIQLWDIKTAEEAVEIGIVTGDTTGAIACSPVANIFAFASHDNTIQLWDMHTKAVTGTLTGHTSKITSIVFSLDGNTLASASEDNTLRLWNIYTGIEIGRLTRPVFDVYSMAFSPDGSILATTTRYSKNIRLWDTYTGKEVLRLRGNYLCSTAFNPNDSTLLTSSAENLIGIYGYQSLRQVITAPLADEHRAATAAPSAPERNTTQLTPRKYRTMMLEEDSSDDSRAATASPDKLSDGITTLSGSASDDLRDLHCF